MLEHGLQIFEIQQQQSLLVGHFEDDVRDAILRFVQIQQPAQQQAAPCRRSSPGSECLARPSTSQKTTGEATGGIVGDAQLFGAGDELGVVRAGLGHAGQVAFDVAQKDRHAERAQPFGHHAQRDRLARARRPGDQSMPVGHAGQQAQLLFSFSDQNRLRHERFFSTPVFACPAGARTSGTSVQVSHKPGAVYIGRDRERPAIGNAGRLSDFSSARSARRLGMCAWFSSR